MEYSKEFIKGFIAALEFVLNKYEDNDNQSLVKTDIRKSEPLSEQGENPCVKLSTKSEILKDYDTNK